MNESCLVYVIIEMKCNIAALSLFTSICCLYRHYRELEANSEVSV
jgi:hypothetical protein